jgi:hypothetical protein
VRVQKERLRLSKEATESYLIQWEQQVRKPRLNKQVSHIDA